ncbi:hypothetical protein JKP88DRAFT_351550 [Tribonema minus]|uniref:Uncharacterized protein n=1 Tax=Tribonema minus TaxID=303371 RepID=A0A835YGZ6_9STRA|nr:hypothetical protein JKP88DRAFT_351550 [Tribonema minus]
MDDGAQAHAALTFEAQVARMMLSFPDDASIQFLNAGAGNALMEALAASTTGYAASHMLKGLTALAHDSGNAAQLLAAGVAEAIMAAVDKHCTRGRMLSADSKCTWVLSAAMLAIAALAASAPADSARLSTTGACEVVVTAVRLHTDVQESDETCWYWEYSRLEALAALAAAAGAANTSSE